jgi:hypothetical protein
MMEYPPPCGTAGLSWKTLDERGGPREEFRILARGGRQRGRDGFATIGCMVGEAEGLESFLARLERPIGEDGTSGADGTAWEW